MSMKMDRTFIMFPSLNGGSNTNIFYVRNQIHVYTCMRVQAENFFIPADGVNNLTWKS